jgi:rhamnogalacturonyl hydrolase YesR
MFKSFLSPKLLLTLALLTPTLHAQEIDQSPILPTLEKVADAQIAVLRQDPIPLSTTMSINGPTINWIGGTFYLSIGQLARISKNPDYTKFLLDLAYRYNFALRGDSPHDLINADEQCIGALYEELYARKRLPGMIMPLRQRLDYTLPYLTQTPAPPKLTWWWCDSLFMAPPVFTRMSVLTGDPKYLDAMNMQWWRLYDLLYDKTEHLYFRDERFLTRTSKNGKKIFWGRGNGWVIAGLARVLESMPADYPTRDKFITLFKEMSARIATLQQPDGFWSTSLLDPDDIKGPESSGTGFYTFALAWGINHDLLDRATFEPVVKKGWAALNTAILPNGLIGYVQKTGDQPVPSLNTDTGLYGTGAFLLAGLQVMNLSHPPTALPVPEPTPDPAPRIRREPAATAPTLPPNATEAERFEATRRAAEFKAAGTIGYDPARDGELPPSPTTDAPPIAPTH